MTAASSRILGLTGKRRNPTLGLISLLAAIGTVGISSAAHAVPLTVSNTNGAYLQYFNLSSSIAFGAGSERIRYGAGSVIPNGSGLGGIPATTGSATTTNLATGNVVVNSIRFDPGPVDPNNFQGSFIVSANPTSNDNPDNLTGPWTITFQNPATMPTSVSSTLSLVGSEIPFVNSVTLSGTSASPIFSWSPPAATTVNGYRIDIFQNDLISNVPPVNSGQVVAKNLLPTVTSYTVQASDFTVPGFSFKPNVDYTIAIIALQTRDGMSINLNNANVNASSFAYSSFRTLPAGAPPVNLPMVTLVGNQVIFGFSLTVAPGITYYIDPAVATGYIYKTESGNPNFASVELPDVGNPNPYDLYLWNGSAFVFDTTLGADTLFDFADGGVSEFEVLGIDPSLGLDPDNATAFITALTFEGAGNFTGTMTPVTTEVSAPEPASLTVLASGLLGFGLIRRRRRPVSALQKKRADRANLDFGCEFPFRHD